MKRIIRKYSSQIHGPYLAQSLKYGLIMGALLCVGLLIRFMIVSPPSSPISLTDNIIMLVSMGVMVYWYRSCLPQKQITFKEAWLTGFFSGSVASIIFGIYLYVYVVWIDKDMPIRCIRVLKNVEQYKDYTYQQFQAMTTPSTIALQSIIYNIVMAIIWAFCVAIIFRNEKAVKQ